MVITHTASLADEHGADVRDVLRSSGYRLVFGHDPRTRLRDDSQARERLKVEGGGTVFFFGRDKMGGGYGADWIIIDDIIKNALEAASETIREKAWKVYNSDCLSRLNDDSGWLLFVGTRRHADDPPGRIFDPDNSHYDKAVADSYRVVKLPALSLGKEVDQLGRELDEPLWPRRRSFKFWDSLRTSADEVVREDFETQAQCNPRPAQGRFFKKVWWAGEPAEFDKQGNIVKKAIPKTTYDNWEAIPKRLRYYVASDHAITEDQRNDMTVILPFGVDDRKDIWIMPDVMIFRYESPDIVDAMLQVMKKYQPLVWWAEREHISKSILPFLKLKQMEQGIFGYIEESAAVAHPEIRAWSIRGMISARRVHFSSFADWWAKAESQLLDFPAGEHDDFVSALSHAGMGIAQIVAPADEWKKSQFPKERTLAWVKGQHEAAEQAAAQQMKGW